MKRVIQRQDSREFAGGGHRFNQPLQCLGVSGNGDRLGRVGRRQLEPAADLADRGGRFLGAYAQRRHPTEAGRLGLLGAAMVDDARGLLPAQRAAGPGRRDFADAVAQYRRRINPLGTQNLR